MAINPSSPSTAAPANLRSDRITLRSWQRNDGDLFFALHSDPGSMQDLGGPIVRADSDAKLHMVCDTWARHGYGRWCVLDQRGEFLGSVGVARESAAHPLGVHDEIGWRLRSPAMGQGYATEAAALALKEAFVRCGVARVLAYTAEDNLASQAVIKRLGFRRDEALDFSVPWEPIGIWDGLTWVLEGGSD